jgi:dTDP-4-amino-4,6-dideoxygalactose transaminase
MNSGTAPLHVACMIAGFGPGDEVIAPPFTFISTVWGVSYVGATPVFADIEEGTFNLDPAQGRGGHHAAHQGHHRRASFRPAGADG